MTTFQECVTGVAPALDVHVVDLSAKVIPHMSAAAVNALRSGRSRPGWANDVVVVARMWDHVPSDADIRQLGTDISAMVDHVAVDGLLSPPMLIPLPQECDHHLAVVFTRVSGAGAAGVMATLRETLPLFCGLHVMDSGELPPVHHVSSS